MVGMTAPLRCMLLVAIAATACRGAETMGYRFVAEPNTRMPVLKCPLLAQAPTATPFAAAADELHDLTALARAEKIPLVDGWALWNQTRKLLVVRGPLVDQWRIADRFGFDAQSRNVRVTVEWLRANNPAAVPIEPAFASLGVLGRSNMVGNASTTLKTSDGNWKFSAEVTPNMWENEEIIDIGITAKWKGPGVGGVQHGSLTTSAMVADGRACSLANWYAVGYGDAWWLRLKADLLLADGSCWRDARLRQVGELVQSWRTFTPAAPDGTLPQVRGWQVGVKPVAWERVRSMVKGDADDNEVDPFAPAGAVLEFTKSDLPGAVIPEELKDFAAPGMLDLRQDFFKTEGAPPADVFLAYDPICQRVIYGCKSGAMAEQIEMMFTGMDDRWAFTHNLEYGTWLFDAAAPMAPWMKASLAGKWGTKSVMDWHGRNHRPIISLESEASHVENDNAEAKAVLRCRMKPEAAASLNWDGHSTTHLVPGVPMLTDAFKRPDGRTVRQGQRVSLTQARAE